VVVLDSAQAEAGEYTVGAAGERREVRVDAALGAVEWRPGETMAEILGRAYTAVRTSRAAAAVRRTSSSVWAADRNAASNCEGAR